MEHKKEFTSKKTEPFQPQTKTKNFKNCNYDAKWKGENAVQGNLDSSRFCTAILGTTNDEFDLFVRLCIHSFVCLFAFSFCH